jgi:RNA polymerase sigma-70 factor (ECF subfamily)
MDPARERDLVERCRRGDPAAFEELVEQFKNLVFALIARSIPDRSHAEDLAQDVFLRIHRGLPYFRGEARLSTWIYRIAARHATRAGRRRRMRTMLSTLLVREPPPPPIADPSERTDRLRLLDELVAKLSPKKRLVLVLFEIEGIPIGEVARIAGCPENTAWSRLHYARAELTAMARKRVK